MKIEETYTLINPILAISKAIYVNSAIAACLMDRRDFILTVRDPKTQSLEKFSDYKDTFTKFKCGKIGECEVVVDSEKKWSDLTIHGKDENLLENLSEHGIKTTDII